MQGHSENNQTSQTMNEPSSPANATAHTQAENPPAPEAPRAERMFSGDRRVARLVDGAELQILVRRMPVRRFAEVLRLFELEAELLDLVCYSSAADGYEKLPDGWSDALSFDSHCELVDAARGLHAGQLQQWTARQLETRRMTAEIAVRTAESMAPLIAQLRETAGNGRTGASHGEVPKRVPADAADVKFAGVR